MHKYISTLTHIKENPNIDRIDDESTIDVSIIAELHQKGFIHAIDFSNKSYNAFGEISITMEGLSFLEKQHRKTNSADDWYKKPIGIVFLSVCAITLAWFVKHLLSPYVL